MKNGKEIMVENPLVSIIVPVYNVKIYLERCLSSLERQTYANLEVVMVDDCSTDDSYLICERYAERDERFKLLRMQANVGAGRARQYGFEHSHGEVIGFADGDDWMSPDFVSTLLQVMKETRCKIVCCQYYFCFEDGKITTPWPVSNERIVIESVEAIHRMVHYNGLGTELWNKLFAREVVASAKMETCHYEDAFILLKYFVAVKSACLCNLPLYYYNQREGSLMNSSYSPEKELAHFLLDAERAAILVRSGYKDLDFYNWSMRKGIRAFKNFILLPENESRKSLFDGLLPRFKDLYKVLHHKVSGKNRMEAWLVLHAGRLYAFFYVFIIRHFGRRRIEGLKERYGKSSAQFLKDGCK